MTPTAFEVVDSAALCVACARYGSPLNRPELPLLRNALLARDVTAWRGLLFWTPRQRRGLTPLDLYNARGGDRPPTPGRLDAGGPQNPAD